MGAHRILIWFRNDLRLHDHEPLTQALRLGAQVIPLYCFDPRQFTTTPFGFDKTGAMRSQFLTESVTDLQNSLRALGSNLIVRHERPEIVIPQLVQALDLSAIYFHREATSEELAVAKGVEAAVQIPCQRFWGATLYHPDDLPVEISRIPELFTHFRKQVEKQSTVRPSFPTPKNLPPLPNIDAGAIPTLSALDLSPVEPNPRAVLSFQGGETAGRARLHDYIWGQDCLRRYKQTRNEMLGANYSSKFSPWLALGCLSPRLIYEHVQSYETERVRNDSTYWMVFELLWRDFFRLIAAKHGTHLFRQSGLRGLDLPWQTDTDAFECWRQGKTGYPLVDANMRELKLTGFMSNRGRQNVASFLTKNLGINWQWGAEWFESQLIDYDVCSNWGNWNYTAGVGNDAREFRYFNILKQSRDYDAKGDYVRHWLPELAKVPRAKVHEPWRLTAEEQARLNLRLGQDYPQPMVDFQQSIAANQKRFAVQQG
ncbi:Cryptochrome DASH [Acaryochloris thomasi RCC1774]|uniref:Cryptochrome DASH n=1 Tax=Acaryochloris thomasi RCC1774 TaxID=1764569 RepID=A0A2W1JML6_9CYAN|nr:DASH family cryptochrome [Acaryochloris thomasi]PZD74529.1 Cryptochrome DASH [Acaryochloris thomasi RCC1774]